MSGSFLGQILLRQLLFYVSQQRNAAVSFFSNLTDPLESDRAFFGLVYAIGFEKREREAAEPNSRSWQSCKIVLKGIFQHTNVLCSKRTPSVCTNRE